MNLSSKKRTKNGLDESVEDTNNSELATIIKDVKMQIRKHYAGFKEQIERIGNALQANKLIKDKDICTEIKNTLREEIKDKIISPDTIERCCHSKWKRKTKPKAKDPQLRFSEGKNPQEQETVANLNTNITSGGQILLQEQDMNDHSKMEEQEAEADLKGSQQQHEEIGNLSELNQLKMKEEQEAEVLTESKILIIGEIQLALLITVDYKQKKVVSVKLDL